MFLTDSFLPIWAWVKWPVVLVIAFALISILYWGAPNVSKPFRLISPGGVVAILGIAVAAVALSIYMTTVASYSSYGADRKSTRLNSSHVAISYAVFCLKKKNIKYTGCPHTGRQGP